MVTDHRAHTYPWLRDCSSCTCIQISWFKLSGRKFSAMSEIIDSVVSKSILEEAEKGAANVDWFCIPPEKRIVDDSILLWVAGFEEAVSTESLDYEKENSDIENSAKHLKTEAGNTNVKKPLAPANCFEGMTTSDQLATFSRNFEAWADWQIAQNSDDPVPSDILSCGDTVALNKLLSLYVIETRKFFSKLQLHNKCGHHSPIQVTC